MIIQIAPPQQLFNFQPIAEKIKKNYLIIVIFQIVFIYSYLWTKVEVRKLL